MSQAREQASASAESRRRRRSFMAAFAGFAALAGVLVALLAGRFSGRQGGSPPARPVAHSPADVRERIPHPRAAPAAWPSAASWPALAAASSASGERKRPTKAGTRGDRPQPLSPGSGLAWEGAPDWLRVVANTPLPPTYGIDTGSLQDWRLDYEAAVLLTDVAVTLTRHGTFNFRQRYAVWAVEGGYSIAAKVYYLPLPVFYPDRWRTWWLQQDGSVISSDSDSAEQSAWDPLEIRPDIHVWGLEITGSARPDFAQFEWFVQELRRVRLGRLSLTVPRGWDVSWRIAGFDQVTPGREDDTYTWNFRDLPPVPWDRGHGYGPISSKGPRLAIDVFPPADSDRHRPFEDWSAASKWLSAAHHQAVRPAAATTAKAQELAAGLETDAQRIGAVVSFVKSLRTTGPDEAAKDEGRLSMYSPLPVAAVLERGHGDCRDRSALTIALLAVLGIESFPVAVRAEDEYPIRRDWPSLRQFNHQIVAIRTPAFRRATSAVVVPGVGRLLLVDPGDSWTPIGHLSDWVTGPGLLATPAGSGLIDLPTADAAPTTAPAR